MTGTTGSSSPADRISASAITERVGDYVRARCGLHDGATLVVGLSGGSDSVALLSVLSDLGFRCVAAHCNFHLRPNECERDAAHAEAIARRLGAVFHRVDFDVKAECAATGESEEMVCRRLRYEWFGKLRVESGAEAIAVGHHADDQEETLLLALNRSAGLHGMCGIRPRRSGHVVRPLLCLNRTEILGYLKEKGLQYITDSTNSSDTIMRNNVRINVLPQIHKYLPRFRDAAIASMGHLQEAADFIDRIVQREIRRCAAADGAISIPALVEAVGDDAGYVLFQAFRQEGMSRLTAARIMQSHKDGHSGSIFNGRWLLDRGKLLTYLPSDPVCEKFNDLLTCRFLQCTQISRQDFHPVKGDASNLYLDKEAVTAPAHWELRTWRRGDRIEPFGMKGSRLVSDMLSDARLSVAEKERTLVLTRNGLILWVVGLRTSSHFPVSHSTEEILKVSLTRNFF